MRKNWGEQTELASFNGAWHEGWNLPWGSTSHAWSSGPVALLPQKVLGLEPTGYGWKTFAVKPLTGDLMWAKGTVSTVAGDVTAAWEKSAENHFTLKLNIPKETLASVYLPTADMGTVKIDGKTPAEKPETGARIESGKWVVLTMSSGSHQLECETAAN
jgi:hypothetical protein